MRNFTTYIRTIVLAGLAVLGTLSAGAQSYAEGADLNGSQTFTLNAATTYTYSGGIATPGDGQDPFTVIVAAGYQVTNVSYTFTTADGASNYLASFNGNFSDGITAAGTIPMTYPVAAGTYNVTMSYDFSISNTWTLSITVAALPGFTPPANDDVCNAIPLSIGTNGPYDNTNATIQAGEPANGGSSVWFTLAAPASGHATILAPDFNTELSLYDLVTCGDFTTYALIANDDNSGSAHGGVAGSAWIDAACLTPGHTYYVQLSGTGGATGSTDIDVASVANQAPTLSACPADITGCSANPTFTAPTATDPEGCSVTVTPDHASGSTFPTGTTTVTYTAIDNIGATATCSFTVTVINPTVNTVSDQTVCNGAATSTVTFSGTGTSYSWTGSNSTIGLASSGTGNIPSFTAINTGTTAVTDVITVTPIDGVCSGTAKSFNITVNPTPTVTPTGDQNLCNNSATTAVNFTGAVVGTVYNWVGNNGTIGLATSGAGNIASFTATNTGTAPVSDQITVTPSYTNAGATCTGTADVFFYTVNPTPTVAATADQTVCNGGTTTAVTFTGTVPGTVYNWIGSNSTIGLATSGTGNIASFTAVNNGNSPVSDRIIVTPTYTNGAVTCTGTPDTFFIIVNPTPRVNPTTDQVLCNGSATTAVTFTGPVAGTVYSWTGSNGTIGLANSGTGNIASFTAVNTTTDTVRDMIIVTPSYTNAGTTCTGTSDTFFITVNPTPTVNPTADQAVCIGAATAAITFTGGVTGTIYSWTGDNATIGLATSGTGNIASFTATNAGTTAVTDMIIVTPSYTNGTATCTGTPDTFYITVNPTPTVNPSGDQVLCNTSSSAPVSFTGNVVPTDYLWTSNGTVGLATSGTGGIPSFVATNNGNTPVTDTIIVTPSYTNAGATCTGTPDTFFITVNPTPNVNPAQSDIAVCNNGTASVTYQGTVPGTVYTWTGTNGTIGIPTGGTGDIATFTATNATSAPVIDTIIVVPSYTNAGVTCTGPSDTFTITVNPTPTVNPTNDQIVCNTGMTSVVNFTGATTGTDYLWTGSTATIGLATSGTGNIASFPATNPGAVAITDTIIVTPSYTNAGVTCTGTPDTFFITVNPTPDVNPNADQFVCNSDTTSSIAFTGKVIGSVFDWTGSNGTIGLPTSGTGDIASFTAINTGSIPVTDTIIVTPSYTNMGVTCTGTPDTILITVNPTPIITPSADQALCNGATTTAVIFSNTVTGTTYAWTNSDPSTGLAASGTGNIPSFTAVNTSTADVIDTIVVTPTSADGCIGSTDTFTITVHPSPKINLGPDVNTCGGNVQIDAGNPGSTYMWSNGATTQIDTVSASGAYYVTVTTQFGCIDSAGPKNIYIKPAPVVNLGADATYCGGTATLDAGNPGAAYLWSTGATTQTIVVSVTGDYGVIVTDTASGCFGSDTVHITFNTPPTVDLGPDTTLCGGKILLTAGDPVNTYVWSPGGSTSNTLLVTTSGTYSVVVTSPNGCTATDAITVTIFSKPNLGADQADSICQGTTADLYSYFPGAGVTLTFNTPTPSAVDTGTYTAIGTNANGCSDTAIVTISYRVKPDLGIDRTDSVCLGYTYNLRNLYPNTGYSTYAWSGTFTDTAVGPGTYTLVVSNASGCTDTAVATIVTGQKPNLGGNKTDSVCSGTTYNLTTLYPNTGYSSYHWTGVADSSAVNAGTYQLVVSNGAGCTDTAYATITNRRRAVVTLNVQNALCSTVPAFLLTGGAPAGGTYFVNGVITNTFDPALTGSGPQRVVYVFTNAGGCVDSAVTFVTVYPQPNVTNTTLPVACSNSQAIDLDQYFSPLGGSYTGPGISGQYFYPSLAGIGASPITYIYTDSHGCMDTGNASITVTNQVAVSLHTTTVNYTSCAGQPFTFIANGATDYQFFVNGTAVTGISDTDTYTSTTLQDHDQVTVVGSNACSTDTSDFIIVDINQAPVVNAGMDTTIELGQTAQLNGTATGGTGNLTYSWVPSANLNFNNVPNPKYNGPDSVTLVLTVTDVNGCFGTDTVNVNVHVPDNVTLPNILTPNGDGQNDEWVLNSKINLAGSHLLIFNRWGEKVYEADSYANNWKGTYMNTNDKLPDGTYYYVLKVPAQNNHEYTGPINILSSK